MEWLNFRHLYSFWMVCKNSGFKNAAEKMNVSQSAVSEQVKLLEDYLGETLLKRSTRSIQLTLAGTKVLSYAEAIFEQSRELNLNIRDGLQLKTPPLLRVGVVGGVSRNFLFRMISSYVTKSDQTKVSVSSGSYDELYRLLKVYDLDIIITLELPEKRDLEEVSYRKVGQSPLCLAGKKSVIAKIRNGKSTRTHALYNFRFPHEIDLLEDVIIPQTGIRLAQRLDTDDIPLLRFFATSGSGLAVLPEVGVKDDLEAGTLDRLLFKQFPEVGIYGIFLKKPIHREAIESLLDF